MKSIFINLKRFDISKRYGGICPADDPQEWIRSVIHDSAQLGLGANPHARVIYLLPEGLISAAIQELHSLNPDSTVNLSIGCQGVHWEDVSDGGNFGAFTTSLPAKAAKNFGCTWTIIGHSEERKSKLQILEAYDARIKDNPEIKVEALSTINGIIRNEVLCALQAGLNVLLCIGETQEERGEGEFEDQKPRVQRVLKSQLLSNLEGVGNFLREREIAIGYEPIWAIGPGKIPPGEEYIRFVSSNVKDILHEDIDLKAAVVYGGGLKEENAGMLSNIESIDGGLVALTRFTGDIGFDVTGLQKIIENYIG
ncbi:MAG: triosephosphate isomerase [Anaerolineales bacterium]|nr:triosephosphate isomerase [Anaerolineales bacterium]